MARRPSFSTREQNATLSALGFLVAFGASPALPKPDPAKPFIGTCSIGVFAPDALLFAFTPSLTHTPTLLPLSLRAEGLPLTRSRSVSQNPRRFHGCSRCRIPLAVHNVNIC